jgi:hypothetical protein
MYGVVKKGKEEIDKYNMFNDLLIYHYFSSRESFLLLQRAKKEDVTYVLVFFYMSSHAIKLCFIFTCKIFKCNNPYIYI